MIPRRSQLLALSQGDVVPRGPTPSGESCGFPRSGGERGRGGDLCLGGLCGGAQSCSLPPETASPTGNGLSTGRATGHLIFCTGCVHSGDPWHSRKLHLQTESSSRLGPFLISHLWPRGSSQRLAVACSSASTQSRATHSPGDHSHGWAGPGEQQQRQAQREGGAAGQSRATGCQQRVVLLHIRPPLTPATSLGTLEAGCCVLPPLR